MNSIYIGNVLNYCNCLTVVGVKTLSFPSLIQFTGNYPVNVVNNIGTLLFTAYSKSDFIYKWNSLSAIKIFSYNDFLFSFYSYSALSIYIIENVVSLLEFSNEFSNEFN